MTLGDLASVGEFIGGAGVILTLIFVGVQLRHNTRAVQISTAREAGNSLADSLKIVQANSEFAETILRAWESLESLSASEKFQFDTWLYGWLAAHEQEYFASREDPYFDELLPPKHRVIAMWLLTPGGSAWWAQSRGLFSDSFQRVVDDIRANPPEGYADLYPDMATGD